MRAATTHEALTHEHTPLQRTPEVLRWPENSNAFWKSSEKVGGWSEVRTDHHPLSVHEHAARLLEEEAVGLRARVDYVDGLRENDTSRTSTPLGPDTRSVPEIAPSFSSPTPLPAMAEGDIGSDGTSSSRKMVSSSTPASF